MRSRLSLGLALSVVVLAGCGDEHRGDAVDLGDWCAEAGGPSLPTCTKLHGTGSALRLPADEPVGVIARGGATFVTANGSLPLALRADPADMGIAGSGHGEYATSLYRATIVDGSVTDLVRVAAVDENAVLTSAFGGRVMEGTIGRLVGPDSYAFDDTLPVRFEFAPTASDGRLSGRIVNATAAVTSSDGRCLGSLAAADGNPLVGLYTAEVWLTRVPSMHTTFDDELVLHWGESVSNMGGGFYPSLATLTGADPLAEVWDAALHGNPTYGPPLSLRLVTGGGTGC